MLNIIFLKKKIQSSMFKSDPVAILLFWEGARAEYYFFEKNNSVSMFKSSSVGFHDRLSPL